MWRRLLARRMAAKIHRSELALATGFREEDILCWEKGLAVPTRIRMIKWLHVLGKMIKAKEDVAGDEMVSTE